MTASITPPKTNSQAIRWQALFQAGIKKISQHIADYNSQYPTKEEVRKLDSPPPTLYKRSYPLRIKESEEKTIFNVFKVWCKQAADLGSLTRSGNVVNNIVSTNRAAARNWKRCTRGTNAHLAKAAHSGILLGTQAHADSPKEYRCQFTQGGKGYGTIPLKEFRGTTANFLLLFNPSILPLENLKAAGIKLDHLESFLPPDMDINKGKNLPHSLSKFNPINKEIIDKAVDCSAKNEVPEETENIHAITKDEQSTVFFMQEEGNENKVNTPPIPSNQDFSLVAAYLNIQEGKKDQEAAKFLIEDYCNKIAKAMGIVVFPTQKAKGVQSALDLILSYPETERETLINDLHLTIDHIAKYIALNPALNRVAMPSKYFSRFHTNNIIKGYNNYYLVYRQRSEEFKELYDKSKKEASNPAKLQYQEDFQVKDISVFHNLAYQFKSSLTNIHQTDYRLKMSKIETWANDFKALHEKDGYKLETIVKVLNYLLNSPTPSAKFYRLEIGRSDRMKGVRSVKAFRRNFEKIYACMLVEVSKEKDKKKAKQIPRTKKHTQIPS